MGKGEELHLSLISSEDRPPGVRQILHEAANLLGRSWKLMLCILLILPPHHLLFSGNYLIIIPLITDMVSQYFIMGTEDPRSPEYHELLASFVKDLRELTGAEVISKLISYLLSVLLVMATVYTVAMAKKGELMTLKDLLSRMRRGWDGAVATYFYVSVIGFGYTAIWFLLIRAVAFIAGGSVALDALGAVVSISGMLLLLYLEMFWCQGLVISVAEEDCYGLAALGKASELTRGRRRLGFTVNTYLLLITLVIFYVCNYSLKTYLPPGVVGGLIMFYVNLLISAFKLAAYVVFYYECRKSHGEEVVLKGSLVYTGVPTAPTPDGALP